MSHFDELELSYSPLYTENYLGEGKPEDKIRTEYGRFVSWDDVVSITQNTPHRNGYKNPYAFKAGKNSLESWTIVLKNSAFEMGEFGARFRVVQKYQGQSMAIIMLGVGVIVEKKGDVSKVKVRNELFRLWDRLTDVAWSGSRELYTNYIKGASGGFFEDAYSESTLSNSTFSWKSGARPKTLGGYLQVEGLGLLGGYYGAVLPRFSFDGNADPFPQLLGGAKVERDYFSIKEIQPAKVANRFVTDGGVAEDAASVREFGLHEMKVASLASGEDGLLQKAGVLRPHRRIEVESPIDTSFHFYGDAGGGQVARTFERPALSHPNKETFGFKMEVLPNANVEDDNNYYFHRKKKPEDTKPIYFYVKEGMKNGTPFWRISGFESLFYAGIGARNWLKVSPGTIDRRPSNQIIVSPSPEWTAWLDNVLLNGADVGLPFAFEDYHNLPSDLWGREWYLQETIYDIKGNSMITRWVDSV